MKLVDQMIVEHMFHLTKTQVTMFVSTVLKTGLSPLRDGFFKANLVFTKQGKNDVQRMKTKGLYMLLTKEADRTFFIHPAICFIVQGHYDLSQKQHFVIPPLNKVILGVYRISQPVHLSIFLVSTTPH